MVPGGNLDGIAIIEIETRYVWVVEEGPGVYPPVDAMEFGLDGEILVVSYPGEFVLLSMGSPMVYTGAIEIWSTSSGTKMRSPIFRGFQPENLPRRLTSGLCRQDPSYRECHDGGPPSRSGPRRLALSLSPTEGT